MLLVQLPSSQVQPANQTRTRSINIAARDFLVRLGVLLGVCKSHDGTPPARTRRSLAGGRHGEGSNKEEVRQAFCDNFVLALDGIGNGDLGQTVDHLFLAFTL